MNVRTNRLLILLGMVVLSAAIQGAQQPVMTATGTVSDTTCGMMHRTDDARACTLACVGGESDYAFVVVDTVYTLTELTDETRAQLEELAGTNAVIAGYVDVQERTIEVVSVSAAD